MQAGIVNIMIVNKKTIFVVSNHFHSKEFDITSFLQNIVLFILNILCSVSIFFFYFLFLLSELLRTE
jgi:hypothetical protein